jgi:hypothetical protein
MMQIYHLSEMNKILEYVLRFHIKHRDHHNDHHHNLYHLHNDDDGTEEGWSVATDDNFVINNGIEDGLSVANNDNIVIKIRGAFSRTLLFINVLVLIPTRWTKGNHEWGRDPCVTKNSTKLISAKNRY